MKYTFLSILMVALATLSMGQKTVEVTFDTELIELGSVKKGDIKTFVYNFTNTGKEDIEIDLVSGCDCTTLDWTRGIIKPGEKGKIDVKFDSGKKEESETVSVEMYLKNIDPRIDASYLYMVEYDFTLVD